MFEGTSTVRVADQQNFRDKAGTVIAHNGGSEAQKAALVGLYTSCTDADPQP